MSCVMAALLAGSSLTILIGSPTAAAAETAAPARCASTAPDEAAAVIMARACATRVEVESERTEYAEVFAEPSGVKSFTISAMPQRAKRLDGTWGAIDTALQAVGGQLAPIGTAANVRFSAGGSGPFVTMTHRGRTFTMSWPHALPTPTVSGNAATYPEVLPGVDLTVKATSTGFTHMLVVRSPQAAANPVVRHARYLIGGDAVLSSTPEGGLIAEADGVRVATGGEALMWDTARPLSARTLALSGLERTPERKVARVAHSVSGRELRLVPDLGLLDDPWASFPVVIDPPFDIDHGHWAYATSNNSNGPTTDTDISAGDPSPAAAELRVGRDPEVGRNYRSFMHFPLGGLHGKQILSAKIWGRVDHTWKCNGARPTYFYRTAGISASPRQAWPGPALQQLLGNNSVWANEASCNESNMPFEVSTGTLVNDLQFGVNSGWPTYTMGISASGDYGATNEGHTERWMRYFLNDFQLQGWYNTKPNMPDSLTVDNKACASGANRPFVKTLTPTLRAHVTDPDGDSMNVWFAWAKWNGSAWVDQPGNGSQGNVPHNGTALFNTSGLVDGGIYTFRSQSDDAASHNPYLVSDVTHMPGNCEWEVDMQPPAVPTVVADIYKEGPTGCPGGSCGAVGMTGRFTLSSSPDTQSFLWGFTFPPTNVLNPAVLGGSADLDWTPTSSGAKSLFVRAVDRAGNERDRTFQFVVAAQTPALMRWKLDDSTGSMTVADDTGNGVTGNALNGVTLGAPGRLAPGNDGTPRSAASFDGVDDRIEAPTGSVVQDTSRSFSVSTWVKLHSMGAVTQHAIALVGTNTSLLFLQYNNSGTWRVATTSADVVLPTYTYTTATSVPRLNTWTHLAVTYDSAAKTLRLYVNGVLDATGTGITTWDTTGRVRIGGHSSPLHGSLAEVQVWNRMISANEVFDLVDPIKVGLVAEYRLEEVGPGPAFDSSGMVHDLSFYNGAHIPPSGAGHDGTGLRLDGVDDYAGPDEAVVYTDQSFTVSAWVRPAATSFETFLAQESVGGKPGFVMYYDNGNSQWKIKMYATSTSDETTVTLAAAAATTPTDYHHLVGVFDAQKLELRLYVDGNLAVTRPMNAAFVPWHESGKLLIGRGPGNSSPAQADVDEIRIYQGVVTDVTRIP